MAVFLTKKYLSRRTFLRGTGVALGLPFLEAMVPGGDGAGPDGGYAENPRGILLPPARHDHEQHGRSARKSTSGPRAARARTSRSARRSRRSIPSRSTSRRSRTSRTPPRAVRCTRATRRRGCPACAGHAGQGREHVHHARPGDRAEARAEDRAALAGGLLRDHHSGGGVWWRGLLLRFHDFLRRPQLAAADGIQPAQGVHPAHG